MRRQAIFAILLTLGAGGCGANTPPAIFLGHVVSFTGADAPRGKSADFGVRLALETLGPTASEAYLRRPLVVRRVDAAGNLDNAEAAAARLVHVNRAAALLGGWSVEEALRLDRARAPVLAATGHRASAMTDMLFTMGLPPATQGAALAQYLVDEATPPGILVVDSSRDEYQRCAEAFRGAWDEAQLKKNKTAQPPRWREVKLPTVPTAKSWIATVLDAKPRVVVFVGGGAEFEALRQGLGSAKVMLIYAGRDGDWTPEAAITGDNVVSVTAFAIDAEPMKASDFVTKYRAKHRVDPDVHAALAYDSVLVLAEALKKAPADQPDRVRAELLNLKDIPGATGALNFGKDGQLLRPAFVARWRGPGSAPVVVRAFEP